MGPSTSTTGELARARLLTCSFFFRRGLFVCGRFVFSWPLVGRDLGLSLTQFLLSSSQQRQTPARPPSCPSDHRIRQKRRSIGTPAGDLAPCCLPRVQRPAATPATTATDSCRRRRRPTRRASDGHLRRRRRDRLEPQQHDPRRQGLPQPALPIGFFRRSSALFRRRRRRRSNFFWWPRFPENFFVSTRGRR